jgi:hypothetical protein
MQSVCNAAMENLNGEICWETKRRRQDNVDMRVLGCELD